MNILVICISYNSYEETRRFLCSVNKAAAKATGASIKVAVCDNTESRVQDFDFSGLDNIHCKRYKTPRNMGYFGGVAFVIDSIGKTNVDQYDYVTISNVDLTVDENLFVTLPYTINENTGWAAPAIISAQENRDKNPKIMQRYSAGRLRKIRLLYKYPILDWLYTNTMYRRKSVRKATPAMTEIYAGHGSFIILSQRFVKSWTDYHYPVFLFGEEIYLAENVAEAGMKVTYVPQLRIYDEEHCSTGSIRKSSYYKYNLESIDYILKTYYNE